MAIIIRLDRILVVRAIRFSTLDAICEALNCQPGDILEYVCTNYDDEDT